MKAPSAAGSSRRRGVRAKTTAATGVATAMVSENTVTSWPAAASPTPSPALTSGSSPATM